MEAEVIQFSTWEELGNPSARLPMGPVLVILAGVLLIANVLPITCGAARIRLQGLSWPAERKLEEPCASRI